MPRKQSISALLSKDTSGGKKNLRSKVICNCCDCNGSLVDPRTKLTHEKKRSKKNQSDLSLSLLNLSSQSVLMEQDSINDSDWLGAQKSASIEENSSENSDIAEFTFQPRKRKSVLNRQLFLIRQMK